MGAGTIKKKAEKKAKRDGAAILPRRGAAVLRPYTGWADIGDHDDLESKPRVLGNERGYRVAIFVRRLV